VFSSAKIGFADFKRDITPSIRGLPEMGWVLTSAHHGKGYATEGVRAALAWADEHLRTERTVCLINPDNAASIRVAEKAGYDQKHTVRRSTRHRPSCSSAAESRANLILWCVVCSEPRTSKRRGPLRGAEARIE